RRPRGIATRLASAAIGLGLWLCPPGHHAAAAGFRGGQSPPAQQTPQPARQPDIFWVPTLYGVADDMLKLAKVTADDVVYDLGSGDGRILIIAAQKYRARGVGVEIDPKLVALARQIAVDGEVADKVRFIEGDLFDVDISPATVVTIYLSPTVNRRLEPKLRRELR